MRQARASLVIIALVSSLGASLGARVAYAERTLTLSDALVLARTHRAEISQAEIDLRRAKLNVLRAWLERAHLTVQATASEQLQALNLNGPSVACTNVPGSCALSAHPFTAAAALTVPIWSGLTVEADLAGARARRDAAAADKRAALNGIALDAATAYWEVRRAELDHDVAQTSLERTREIEHTAKIRVDAKIAPSVDYERSHVQTMRQAEQVAVLEAQLVSARAQLGLALQVDDDVRPVDDPAARAPSLPALESALDDAMRIRPELASARATVESERQNVRAAKGAYWPQLSLVASAGASNQQFLIANSTTPVEQVVFTAVAGVQVNWLLFDMLGTWTAVRDAGLVRDRAALTLERQRFAVRADVRTAHGRLAAILARRRAAAEATQSARRALFLLQKRYTVGDALLVELILAQQDLTQSESELNDAAIDSAEAEAQLAAAVGTL